MAAKILVVGSIQGQFQKAFQKITKLHTKTDFAFALVVGDLFGTEDNEDTFALLSGALKIPLPTYFTVGDHKLPESVQAKLESTGEICPNLIYLGRKGTLTTTEGIKIVALGGREVRNEGSLTQSIGRYDSLFLENEARALHGAHASHILLTNQWPAHIASGSEMSIPEVIDPNSGAQSLSNLCATLKPRYHFSSSPASTWAREAFLWPQSYEDNSELQVTRFISLASVEKSNKEWMSAFTLDPSKPPSTEGAQRGAPFAVSSPKRKRTHDGEQFQNHRYGNGHDHSTHSSSYENARGGRHNNKRQRREQFNPDDCFMCLGKPQFDANMVISIGEESFLTSLRGPLSLPDTFSQLGSSGNAMIIPMYHAADESSHGKRTNAEMETEYREMTKYRCALSKMLFKQAEGKLGAVCWEVNRTGIRHFHWQWIACPADLIDSGLVDAAFRVAAEKHSYEKFETCDPDSLLSSQRSDYFRAWIWSPTESTKTDPIALANAISNGNDDGDGQPHATSLPVGTKEVSMFFPIEPNQRFNIQFGREVVAGLLKLEGRTDWKTAAREDGDGHEKRDADAWKEDFAEWDWAMA